MSRCRVSIGSPAMSISSMPSCCASGCWSLTATQTFSRKHSSWRRLACCSSSSSSFGSRQKPTSICLARSASYCVVRAQFVDGPGHARELALELLEQAGDRPPHRRADDAHAQPARLRRGRSGGWCRWSCACGPAGRPLPCISALPATVSSKLRVVRANRRTPSSLSSFMICCDSGGCEMCRRSAARLKLFSSATARKYFSCFRSIDMAGRDDVRRAWRCSATARRAPTRALCLTSAILVARLRPAGQVLDAGQQEGRDRLALHALLRRFAAAPAR